MNDERNLLFGVMAVQLKIVAPQQLMEASAAWALDRERPIRDHLVALGHLSEQVAKMIDGLIEVQIAAHGGDVHATLNSFGGKMPPQDPVWDWARYQDKGALESFGGEAVPVAPPAATTSTPKPIPKAVSSGPRDQVGANETAAESLESADDLTFEQPGRYTIKGEHSRGGIGRVLLAFDAHVGREVAIKELLLDASSGSTSLDTGSRKTTAAASRFLREARVTGQLEHPCIVPVYEIGKRADGTLYYAMRLVRGKTLSQAIRECQGYRERVDLLPHFLDLCHAISYAHSRGVIHRDIKSQNVMVGEFGETVTLDWGLAKIKGKKDDRAKRLEKEIRLIREAGMETIQGAPLGTPAYMSPEQAEGRIEDIDERSDLWSLGAMLYEILTGTTPFEGDNAYEIMGKVLKEDPRPVHQVDPDASDELAAVAMKCLKKDPALRYPSAEKLSRDLERFMTGGLVSAYDYSRIALFRRWLKKWWPVTLTAAVGVAALLVVFAWSYAGIKQQRDQVVKQNAIALINIAEAYLTNGLWAVEEQRWGSAEVYFAKSLTMRDRPQTRSSLNYARTMPRRETKLIRAFTGHRGEVKQIAFDPTGQLLASAGADGSVRVFALDPGTGQLHADAHPGGALTVAFQPQGKGLASAGTDGVVKLWGVDPARPDEPVKLEGVGKPLNLLEFSPAGDLLVAAGDGSTVLAFDLEATPPRRYPLVGHKEKIWYITLNPDASLLATTSRDKTVKVWDLRAKTLKYGLDPKAHTNSVSLALFLPDDLLLSADWDGNVVLWDLRTGALISTKKHVGAPVFASFNADQDQILIGYEAGPVKAFQLAGEARALELVEAKAKDKSRSVAWNAHVGQLLHLIELPYPGAFATCGGDGMMKVWDADYPSPATIIETKPPGRNSWMRMDVRFPADAGPGRGTSNQLLVKKMAAAQTADGVFLAGAGEDGEVRVWSLAPTGQVKRVQVGAGKAQEMALDPAGRRAYIADNQDEPGKSAIAVVALDSGKLEASLVPGDTGAVTVRALSVSKDGKWLAAGDDRGRLHLYDLAPLETGAAPILVRTIPAHDKAVWAVEFSINQKYLVSAGQDERVKVFKLDQGEELWSYAAKTDLMRKSLDVSVQNLLAIAETSGELQIVNLENGATVARFPAHRGGARAVAFSPDGQLLASGGKDYQVKVWKVGTWAPAHTLEGHKHWLRMVGFSPGGKYLASGSILDKTVIVWNAADWSPRCRAELTDRPQSMAFNRAGDLLAIGGRDGRIWLWRPESCDFMIVMKGHRGSVEKIAWFPADGGERLVSIDDDPSVGRAYIWPFPDDTFTRDPEALYRRAVKDVGFTVEGMDLVPAGEPEAPAPPP